MTNLSKVLVVTGFLYASYHINNLVQQYKNYVLEEGYTPSDFGFEGDEIRVAKKKPVRGKSNLSPHQLNEQYLEELALLSQRGKNGFDQGDYKLAFQCFDRIMEITNEYPPFHHYARNATLFLIRIAQEAEEPELFVKYNKVYIESFEEPKGEDLFEIIKCTEDVAEKLALMGNLSEAIDFTRSILKNKKYSFGDIHKIHLYGILASLYKKNEKYLKKELDAHLKTVEYAKNTGDKNAYANYLYELIQYYIKVKNVEKIEESMKEIEKLVATQLLIPILRLLCSNFKKNNMYELFIKTQHRMMDFARKEPQLGKANVENIVIACKNNIAAALLEKGETEESIKIYNELKRSEYLSFGPLTESKYLVTKEVEAKNDVQRIVVSLKPNSLPEDSSNVIVCEFDGSYYLDDNVVAAEEQKEEQEKSAEEQVEQKEEPAKEVEEKSAEEQQQEESSDKPVEEPAKEKEEKSAEEPVKAEEESSVEEPAKEEEEKSAEEKAEEEQEEESSIKPVEEEEEVEKVVYEEVAPVTIEKPMEKEVEFQIDSSKLNPNVGYMATIKLYNQDKSELLSTHIQLIPMAVPKHKLI